MKIEDLLKDYKQISDTPGSVGTILNFEKPIDTDILCNENQTLKLYASVWTYNGNQSMVLEIRAETKLEAWVQLNYYSLRYSDVKDNLNQMEANLIKAWENLNQM